MSYLAYTKRAFAVNSCPVASWETAYPIGLWSHLYRTS